MKTEANEVTNNSKYETSNPPVADRHLKKTQYPRTR